MVAMSDAECLYWSRGGAPSFPSSLPSFSLSLFPPSSLPSVCRLSSLHLLSLAFPAPPPPPSSSSSSTEPTQAGRSRHSTDRGAGARAAAAVSRVKLARRRGRRRRTRCTHLDRAAAAAAAEAAWSADPSSLLSSLPPSPSIGLRTPPQVASPRMLLLVAPSLPFHDDLVSVLMARVSYGARNVLSYTRHRIQNFLTFRDSPIIPLRCSPYWTGRDGKRVQ